MGYEATNQAFLPGQSPSAVPPSTQWLAAPPTGRIVRQGHGANHARLCQSWLDLQCYQHVVLPGLHTESIARIERSRAIPVSMSASTSKPFARNSASVVARPCSHPSTNVMLL